MSEKWQEGDKARITETYSSYGSNENVTVYMADLKTVNGKLGFYVDGKPLSRGFNSTYKIERIPKESNHDH